MPRDFHDRPDEHWALIPSTRHPNTKLALFVHGFEGTYLSTWGALGDMLRQHADHYPVFREWDYLFLGYETGNASTYLDIAHLICTKWSEAANGLLPSGRTYTKLALFGHSLGTLGVRQVLCAWSVQPPGMHGAVHSVNHFGTPLNGSGLAKLATIYRQIARALKPGNPQLRMLRTWTASAHARQPWPDARVYLGVDDKVVGYQSQDFVNWAGDAQPSTTNYNHRKIVKPTAWGTSSIIKYVEAGLR